MAPMRPARSCRALVGVRREGGRVDEGLFEQVDSLDRVGQDETVDAHHDRDRELFARRNLDVKIGRLLIALGETVEPTGMRTGHGNPL